MNAPLQFFFLQPFYWAKHRGLSRVWQFLVSFLSITSKSKGDPCSAAYIFKKYFWLDFFAKSNYCKRIVICNSNIGMNCTMKYLMCTTLFPVGYKNIFYAARSYGQPHNLIVRPGCSQLLEFKKKDSTGCLIETFYKYPD